MTDLPPALERRIRQCVLQLRYDIPPLQIWTAAAQQAAENACTDAILAAVAEVWPHEPPRRDPASTTGGQVTMAAPPRTRHMDALPPQPPRRMPAFGFGKDVTG
jgi:hypothetical protein